MSQLDIQRKFYQFNEKLFNYRIPSHIVRYDNSYDTLGYHISTKKMIVISENVPKKWRCRVLLHEMCHAAVHFIDKDVKCIHGRAWKQWMRKCGMDHKDFKPGDEVKCIFSADNKKAKERSGTVKRVGLFRIIVNVKEYFPMKLSASECIKIGDKRWML